MKAIISKIKGRIEDFVWNIYLEGGMPALGVVGGIGIYALASLIS